MFGKVDLIIQYPSIQIYIHIGIYSLTYLFLKQKKLIVLIENIICIYRENSNHIPHNSC